MPAFAVRSRLLILLSLAWVLTGCLLRTPTPVPPTPTPTSEAQACQFTAGEEITLFQRPDPASDVFDTQSSGFTVRIWAQTKNAWLGLDPGIPQASNVGPFRLRWIEPEAAGELSDGCGNLEVIWGPPAGVCFQMPLEDTNVHQEPDAGSPVVTVLNEGEFPAVTRLSAGGNWAQVDFAPGNTGTSETGWISADALNLNGPCRFLDTAMP